MYVVLSDVLTCPRCGPEWGLLLLPARTENRRVLEGVLSCPNCRERFRIEGGFADLRFPLQAEMSAQPPLPSSSEAAWRMAAALGVTEGPAIILVIGSGAAQAPELVKIVPQLEVIAADTSLATLPEMAGVTRIAVKGQLPLRSGSMRGVALTDAAALDYIEEAARVLAPRARVLVQSLEHDALARLERAGLQILAKDDTSAVSLR